MMLDMLNTIDFHLLRPWWLMAILPALALAWLLLRRRADASGWASVIDSELLNELLDDQQQAQKKWPMLALLLAWILAACAMAGPCFEKNNQAALKQADAVVILLDLSPSMLAQDVQPSRLQAAHYKILDLLHQRREGYTGLIAYSGSAHVVAPLSDDSNTIAALVSTLTPNIMPSIGSSVEDAVSEALQLLDNSHFSRGRILLLTDGVVTEALENIQQQLKGKSVELDVIGIGTNAGAPISLPGGNFVKDNNGNILMNKLDETNLQKLAQENGGYYSPLRADDKDIAPLIAPPDWLAQLGNGNSRDASHTVENWQDIGYWLALPCLLFALLFFRRGVLICLLPLLILTHPDSVRADSVQEDNVQEDTSTVFPKTWKDWWQTPDQQATAALEKNDPATAAKQFTDPQWKAYAEYQNGQHQEAAKHFAQSNSANAEYNRGNAQAKAGDLQGALDSYEQSLKKKPGFSDAEFNRDLVKKLLDEQKNQQDQKKKDNNQQQDQQQQNQDSKDQQQQNQQQQNQDSKDQQQQDQQNQDQQQNQQQQDQQKSDAKNEEQSDAQKSEEQKSEEQKQAENDKKSEEEKQSEADKQAQEEKEQQRKNEQEKQSSESKQPDDKNDPENKDTVTDAEGKSQADKEKQQANEQWLRKVPDDPGGLLKNKFEYYYQLNRQKEARERSMGSSNKEEQRW
jgi:Ca-activated chloride channel family protein